MLARLQQLYAENEFLEQPKELLGCEATRIPVVSNTKANIIHAGLSSDASLRRFTRRTTYCPACYLFRVGGESKARIIGLIRSIRMGGPDEFSELIDKLVNDVP
jgi:hypothetical protein